MFDLRDGPAPRVAPKAARLAEAARAGLPVPVGFVLREGEEQLDWQRRRAGIERLSVLGPMIVRDAMAIEDGAQTSAAGLGLSIANCQSLEDVEAAVEAILQHRRDPWIAQYRRAHRDGPSNELDAIIVQHQVQRRWLVVAAVTSDGNIYIQVHGADRDDALASGVEPAFFGPLSSWDDPARSRVATLLGGVIELFPRGDHGLDLEIIVDAHYDAHLVQVRPLTSELVPGWRAFREEVARAGQLDRLRGTLLLDAEHNPAPLSVAHAWLTESVVRERDDAGHPVVLAGWLYVSKLMRNLSSRMPTPELSATRTLGRLHNELIPYARARLRAFVNTLQRTDPRHAHAALPEAIALFTAMLDTYLGVLVPARAAARLRLRGHTSFDTADPYSLRERERFVDVLPASWDIASRSLAELMGESRRPSETRVALPTDEAQALTLLCEWDDHLFALGIAPLRQVFLHAASALDLNQDDVFLLRGDELEPALCDRLPDLRALLASRREHRERVRALVPPLKIVDGHPVPEAMSGQLRGLPLGISVAGPLAVRRDLEDLLRRPPPENAILAIPSLTAQAALALASLRIRAVCCEHGGPLSHAALMLRELGLSALVGCRGCTRFEDGRDARLDTQRGRLFVGPPRDPI